MIISRSQISTLSGTKIPTIPGFRYAAGHNEQVAVQGIEKKNVVKDL